MKKAVPPIIFMLFVLNLKAQIPVKPDVFYEIRNYKSEMAISNKGAMNNAAGLYQLSTVSKDGHWEFIRQGTYYQIRNKKSKQYIANFKRKEHGAALKQTNKPGEGALWKIVKLNNGYFQMKNKNSGLYLANRLKMNEGAIICQVTRPGEGSWWAIREIESSKEGVSQIKSGVFYKLENFKSKKAISNNGSNTSAARLIQKQHVSEDGLWEFIAKGAYYQIRNKKSGMYIANYKAREHGAAMKQTNNPGDGALWKIVKLNNGYFQMKNKNSGLYLANRLKMDEGAVICQVTKPGEGSFWALKEATGPGMAFTDQPPDMPVLIPEPNPDVPHPANVDLPDGFKDSFRRNPGITYCKVTADTYIEQENPGNHGDSPYLIAGTDFEFGYERQVLLEFNLPKLPEDVEIEQAELNLFFYAPESEGTTSLKVYLIEGEWIENEVNWETKPDVTYLATTEVEDEFGWIKMDVLNAVRGWLNGSFENYGLMVSASTESRTLFRRNFYSKESPSCHPFIDVAYTTNETPPAPPELISCGSCDDNTKPTISLTVTPNSPEAGSTVRIKADAFDAGGMHRIRLLRNGSIIKDEENVSPSNQNLSVEDVVTFEPGIYRYDVLAYDQCMNGSSASRLVRVLEDGMPPSVSITHEPFYPIGGETIRLTINAEDEAGIRAFSIIINGSHADFNVDPPQERISRTFTIDELLTRVDPRTPFEILRTAPSVIRYRASATDIEGVYTSTGTKSILIGNSGPDADEDGLSDTIEEILGTSPVENDTDEDGLYDAWEVIGFDADKDGIVDVDLPNMGASPHHKDVFIEIDWMENSTCSHRLDYDVLQHVANLYRDYGIFLHFDQGNHGGGNSLTHEVYTCNNLANWHWNTRDDNFDADRIGIFHYITVAHNTIAGRSCDGSALGGGVGNIHLKTDIPFNLARNVEVIFHELGHTFGLHHGGQKTGSQTTYTLGPDGEIKEVNLDWEPVRLNRKPNYLSCMNYDYQSGLHIITNDDPVQNIRVFQFSTLPDNELDERNLDENRGFFAEASLGQYIWRRGSGLELMRKRLNGHYIYHRRNENNCASGKILILDTTYVKRVDWNLNGDPKERHVVYDINEWKDDNGTCYRGKDVLTSRFEIPLLRLKIYGNRDKFTIGSASLTPSCLSADPSEVPEMPGEWEVADGIDNDGDGMVDEGFPDFDMDGLVDFLDNAPFIYNPDQKDSDRNNIGDVSESLPSSPQGIKVSFKNKIPGMSWQPGQSQNILGYNIYRKTSDKGFFVRLKDPYPTVLKNYFVDNQCTDKAEYVITIVDMNLQESGYSKVIQFFDTDGDGNCDRYQIRE